MMDNPGYYAVIPASVRYDTTLSANTKLLYGEITSLCNEKGYCYATNNYFADLYGVSKISISRWIKQLIDQGYIVSKVEFVGKTKEIQRRYLFVNDAYTPINKIVNTPYQNCYAPINKNVKENNKEEYIKEIYKEKFLKPSLEDVKKYCEERKNKIDAESFISYYESIGWKVGKNRMKDWKAAIRTWERRNNNKNKQEVEYEPA